MSRPILNPLGRAGARACEPGRPTFFPAGPAPRKWIAFATLDRLGRHVQRLRQGRGLQISAATATHDGSDVFPVFLLDLITPGEEATEFVGVVAVQRASRAMLEEAIRAAGPTRRAHASDEFASGLLVLT